MLFVLFLSSAGMNLETSQAASLDTQTPAETGPVASHVKRTAVSEFLMPFSDASMASVVSGIPQASTAGWHSTSGSATHGSAVIKKLSGDYELIVILVEFTDIKHQRSRDAIHEMVFERMNTYWDEVSYGQFNVIGDTVGWINIGHPESYYGKDTDPKDPGVIERTVS
jgi:hypothetical protein